MLNNIFNSCQSQVEIVDHLQSVFSSTYILQTDLYIGPHIYKTAHVIEEIDIIVRLIRTKWCVIQSVIFEDNAFSINEVVSSRTFINEAFKGIVACLQKCDCPSRKEYFVEETLKHLKVFLPSIVPLNSLTEVIKIKIVSSRNTDCHFNEYFHTLLEIQYYKMILYYLCGLTVDEMETNLTEIMKNLSYLCKVNFSRKDSLSYVFTCNCLKNLWLVVQLLTEKMSPTTSVFWKIFNSVLEGEEPLFALTTLRDVAYLQCFNILFEDIGPQSGRIKPNYTFLEINVKKILSDANSEVLLSSLKLIEPLLQNLWQKVGKIEVYQMIWDFYSKRLNVSNKSSFTSALQLNETLDAILWNPIKNCTEDFETFVGLLVAQLREYPYHWPKMKGRIYSQLGPNKVKDLSEIGIGRITVLFLALSAVQFDEIEKKLMAFLGNIPQEKRNTTLVWNLHSAVILKYVREGRSVEKVAPPLAKMLQEASTDQNMFHLIKAFLDDLENIIVYSTSMLLQQWLLFGSWWTKYQSVCYYTDLNKTLEITLRLLEKCCDADSWSSWETTFKDVIYPSLSHLALISKPPSIIGTIAGKLSLLYNNIAAEAFMFYNSDTISPDVSLKFLEVILEAFPYNYILTPQQENLIVQSWMKICLLTMDPQCHLTQLVIKLQIFPSNLKNHLKAAHDPVGSFIEYLGSDPKKNKEFSEILQLCELCFGQVDKSLGQYLASPENEDVVFKLFNYIALAFKYCGILLYSPNRPVSPMTRLVQTLILPTDFLIGRRTPHAFVLSAIRRTWHLFFEAFVILINTVNKDNYLERTLRDMVVKYMPYFPANDSPFVKCLENENTVEVMLEKINFTYFTPPFKESDANVSKALTIISNFTQSCTSIDTIKLVLSKILKGLFEVVICHSQRNTAIGVIKVVTSSPFFPQMKTEFRNGVLAITNRNLGINTGNYFQLMICLARFAPRAVRDLLEDIKTEITNVERMRGVGFDKTLRLHLQKLENTLNEL